jgi:hypothetical protein
MLNSTLKAVSTVETRKRMNACMRAACLACHCSPVPFLQSRRAWGIIRHPAALQTFNDSITNTNTNAMHCRNRKVPRYAILKSNQSIQTGVTILGTFLPCAWCDPVLSGILDVRIMGVNVLCCSGERGVGAGDSSRAGVDDDEFEEVGVSGESSRRSCSSSRSA